MGRKSKRHWTATVVPWGTREIAANHPHVKKSAKERGLLATTLFKEAYVFHFRQARSAQPNEQESHQRAYA
jgi:hypothetical protein